MSDLLGTIRYALRSLRRAPGFTLAAGATLALGIGANTAIFSVTNAVLLRPLPYQNPDRLVVAWERNLPRARERNVVASVNYLVWRDAAADLGEFAALGQVARTLAAGDGAERLGGAAVTPNLARVLGAAPALGRWFTMDEGLPGHEPVIILSHALWQRRFGGDSGVVGSAVTLDDRAYTVAGVMPREFRLPAVGPFGGEAFLLPLALDPAAEYQGRSLFVLGRLAPDETAAGAQALLRGVAARLAEQHAYDEGWSVNVVPLFDEVVGEARTLMLVLLGAVGLVLLIACVNVAAMVLARGSARDRELAVRQALGAGRWRLARQLLAEGLVLATLAAVAGLAIGAWGRDMLVALAPEGMPRLDDVTLSPVVLGVAAGVTLLTGVALGLVPLVRAGGPDLQGALRGGGRGLTERGGRRLRDGLVLVEVALAVVLSIAAGLTLKSFTLLRRVNPGYRSEGVLTARIALDGDRYDDDAAITAFYATVLDRLRARPGVVDAAATARLPLDGLWVGTSFVLRDRPEPPRAERPVADIRVVTPRYFPTMGIPTRAGRDFAPGDREGAPRVAVINETMARTYWPDGTAVGQQVAVNIADPTYLATIVGVVGDVKHQGYRTTPRAMIYLAHDQLAVGTMSVALRAGGDPAALAGMLRAEVTALDPAVPVYAVAPMTDLVARSMAADRFATFLFTAFAALALMLAAIGTYGIVAFGVTRRLRELGIRVALGAARRRVLALVVQDGMRPVVAGMVVGLAAAVALTRLLRTLLFAVSPTDPATFASAALLLLGAALIACLVPARRAAAVDPVEVLRDE
ncbi:MAG TPA: ABC transporter permease [Gemmatimonadales bacterium]